MVDKNFNAEQLPSWIKVHHKYRHANTITKLYHICPKYNLNKNTGHQAALTYMENGVDPNP